MDRLYLTEWVQADGEFWPASYLLWRNWRAVDGRADPEVAGGICLVLCFNIDTPSHDAIVLLPNTQEITLGNIQALSLATLGVQLDTFEDAMEYAELLTGDSNINYPDKSARRAAFRAARGL